MSALPTGALLPESMLSATWFAVFALFVAFNTIIYLGLTLAKFLPWPTPVGPTTVRRLIHHNKEEAIGMRVHPSAPSSTQVPLNIQLRRQSARETIPIAMTLVGALTVLISLVNVIVYFDSVGPLVLLGALAGVVFVALAQVLSRTSLSSTTVAWVWTIAMGLLIIETSWRAALLNSAVLLTYAAMALLVIAPVSLSWSAGATGALLGLAPISIAGYDVSSVDTVSWFIAAASAATASLILLHLRITSLNRIAEEESRADTLASTDSVTGTFSRAGLLALAPTVAASAERAGADVTVVSCDLLNLTQTNAEYGIKYGDDLLAATARAVRATLPEDALVARWSGSRFLALMLGTVNDPGALGQAVESAIVTSGVTLGKQPARVSVGVASGSPGSTTFELLTEGAEAAAAKGRD
jgi:diguanylate cyclase (GGDEF)-like protein